MLLDFFFSFGFVKTQKIAKPESEIVPESRCVLVFEAMWLAVADRPRIKSRASLNSRDINLAKKVSGVFFVDVSV